MTGKIIKLERFAPGFIHSANGVKFPQLYRGHGYFADDVVDGTLTPSDEKAPIFHTLSDSQTNGLTNVTFEPIRHLNPGIDSGWVVIRHHMSPALVEGYLDAIMDLNDGIDRPPLVYETSTGLFTLHNRSAKPNCTDHLIICVTKTIVEDGPIKGHWVDRWHIVKPDGSITFDADEILYPPDDE